MHGSAWIAVGIGAIIGGVLFEGLAGAVVGALLVYLLAAVSALRQRLSLLEQKLTTAPAPAAAVPEPAPAKPTAAEPAPPPAPEHPTGQLPPLELEDEPAAAPPPRPAATPPRAAREPSGFDQALARVQAWLTGGNLPVRLGVVILFFGVAFLLRYSAERGWLPIELRLAGVAAGGIALLVTGWRLRARHAGYGLMLQGGGVGVLYLTVFGALRLYHLVPPELAFALLVALAAFSSVLAVLQNAQSLAALSAAGGFLAPLLASTGSGSHVALFTYYALINAGIFGISYFKAWRWLNLIGFVFTFGVATAWGAQYYRPTHFTATEPFLILFFLMYVIISVLFALRQPPRLRGYVDGTLVFGTPIAVFALQSALVRNIEFGLAVSATAMAGLYLGLAWLLWRRTEGLRLLTEAFLALGVVFASLAVPLSLDGHWTAATWALEGAALVWVGVRQQRVLARLFGLLLQFGAGVAALAGMVFGHAPDSLPVVNASLLAGLCIALAGLFAAWYLFRHREVLRTWERDFYVLPLLWGLAWWYGSAWLEIERQLPDGYEIDALMLHWAASAALAAGLSRRWNWPALMLPAWLLVPALWLSFLGQLVVGRNQPFAYAGFAAWPLAFVSVYWILWRLEDRLSGIGRGLHALSLWLLAAVASWQFTYWIDHAVQGAGTWPLIACAVIPGLMVMAVSRLHAAPRWPFATHGASYLRLGLAPLVAALLVWSLAVNLGSRGDPWPLAYLPLLNPLDLAQILVFLVLIRWWRVLAPERSLTVPATGVLGAVFFLWLNAVVARSVHHWAGVPHTLAHMLDSVTFQASISLLWSVLALLVMGLAHRLRLRSAWFVGAALTAAVVAKLFLVDLANSGTVARIVSFLGVGLLLLVIGYLAPLPPSVEKESRT